MFILFNTQKCFIRQIYLSVDVKNKLTSPFFKMFEVMQK
jgi:hypothetical protein